MAQTSILTKQVQAFEGMVDSSWEAQVDSVVNENAAEVPFGYMTAYSDLVGGGFDQAQMYLLDNTLVPRGIAVHSHAFNIGEQIGTAGIKQYVVFGVMVRGRIWVPLDEAATEASAVRFYGDAATGVVGTFTVGTHAGETVLMNHAKWKGYNSALALGLLEFDLAGGVTAE